jgi:energy-coupling factor transport system ATP-binding protein
VAALPAFQFQNLNYIYPERKVPSLKNIDLTVEEGEFLLITGGSGSGKSTLARAMAGLIPDFYGGYFSGKIFFKGQDIHTLDKRKLARLVGIVFQDPEKQLVRTCVEAEIAFGLENLGLSRQEMTRRIAEVASFLDLTEIKNEFTQKLSGGQKQKLALASVLAMQPEVLILDEPTSQLDPAGAEDFLNLTKRLNEDMGMTIVLVEQRLERCFHLADRVVIMEDGKIKAMGSPEKIARKNPFWENPFLPPVARFFARVGFLKVPVTLKEGREILNKSLPEINKDTVSSPKPSVAGFKEYAKLNATSKEISSILELKNVWFSYPDGREVLKDINLKIEAGEQVTVMGANGAGKSTLLKVMAGLLKPGRGSAILLGKSFESQDKFKGGKVAYLSQNPNDYLFQDTVEEELLFTLKNFSLPDNGKVDELLERLNLKEYKKVNPRDLSSGERQRVALASILVTDPVLLLLDEPTRGMDYGLKTDLGRYLSKLCQKGIGVVMVTHDVEFAAEYSQRVVLMYDGKIVSDGSVHEVLGNSFFYSTQMARLCKGYVEGVLTVDEAVKALEPHFNSGTVLELKK